MDQAKAKELAKTYSEMSDDLLSSTVKDLGVQLNELQDTYRIARSEFSKRNMKGKVAQAAASMSETEQRAMAEHLAEVQAALEKTRAEETAKAEAAAKKAAQEEKKKKKEQPQPEAEITPN